MCLKGKGLQAATMSLSAGVLFALLFAIGVLSDVEIGSKIGTGETWKSSSNGFLIGFAATKKGKLNLSIWYAEPKAIVWTWSGGNFGKGAKLELKRNGLFVDGKSIATCNPRDGDCVHSASMEDNGNFLVRHINGSTLWQSFDSPTDTLLPNQTLPYGRSLSESSGRFTLIVEQRRISLGYKFYNRDTYWRTDSNDVKSLGVSANLSLAPGLTLSLQGQIAFQASSPDASWYTNAIDQDSSILDKLRRLKLDSDGNFRLYSLQNMSWEIVWVARTLECDVWGTCGAFGLCTYRPTRTCVCPPGFRPIDEQDISQGCDYNIKMQDGCPGAGNSKFVQVSHADYYDNDSGPQSHNVSLEQCKQACMSKCDCLAAAYKYEGSGICYLKSYQGKLYNGRHDIGQNNIVFLKVSKLDTSVEHWNLSQVGGDPFDIDMNATLSQTRYPFLDHPDYFMRHLKPILIGIAIGQVVMYPILAVTAILYMRRRLRKMWQRYLQADSLGGAPARFSYQELVLATVNFSQTLGSGGFGTVYKGRLPGNKEIAVKRLNDHGPHGETEFKSEMRTIGRIRHSNLVSMVGYCVEGGERLLVYEYMPNGSLEKLLFRTAPAKGSSIGWKTRYDIALGVARGITYLHEECHDCILHCDIKPQNILLDASFFPKVADFGLAKLLSKDQAGSITSLRGTKGYIAPEWLSESAITTKADVYSFGMLLFEILSGRDKMLVTTSALATSQWYFPDWAWKIYVEGDVRKAADPTLTDEEVDWEAFERLLKVALVCISDDPADRPAMSKVVEVIEGRCDIEKEPAATAPTDLEVSSISASSFLQGR